MSGTFGAAVLHYWKDEERLRKLKTDFKTAGLTDADLELCNFANKLTNEPNHDSKASTEKLKSLGLSDRAILDATLIISYFNFVNRIVLGLGLKINEDELLGYNYD